MPASFIMKPLLLWNIAVRRTARHIDNVLPLSVEEMTVDVINRYILVLPRPCIIYPKCCTIIYDT